MTSTGWSITEAWADASRAALDRRVPAHLLEVAHLSLELGRLEAARVLVDHLAALTLDRALAREVRGLRDTLGAVAVVADGEGAAR